ncbi:hypothetical protein SUGI_0681450 [Cryptomeria japonica]|nr:hypothetical protein SUGI_0681450 [Cryptomeria japonica]
MEMKIRVWQNLPDEIALNIIARLLPRRSLVRLRTVWKEWNEMLSSYAAMQRMYPNIHLSYTSSFLFQFRFSEENVHSWLIEGTGDFYKVGEFSYYIENACNAMFYLTNDEDFYLCDEKSRSSKPIPDLYSYIFIANAFDSSTEQFIMVVGIEEGSVGIYNSLSDSWNEIVLSWEYSDLFWLSKGVYHRRRFYWLDHVSCNGGVVELNLSDRHWIRIPPPHDAIYRHSDYTAESFDHGDVTVETSIAGMYWSLAGSEIGPLILVDSEYGLMWELENGGENTNSKRWRRVDIRLPNDIQLISVNNSGWTVVVAEEIDVYDESKRLVRKIALDDIDLGLGIEPLLLPFECTYLWWPGHQNIVT